VHLDTVLVAVGLWPASEPGVPPGGSGASSAYRNETIVSVECHPRLFRAAGCAPLPAGATPASTIQDRAKMHLLARDGEFAL